MRCRLIHRSSRSALAAAIAAVTLPCLTLHPARAAEPVGGLTYDPLAGTGYRDADFKSPVGTPLTTGGAAVGFVKRFESGADRGERATRFDALGNAIELNPLTADPSGLTYTSAYSINASDQVSGWAYKYVGGDKGYRAVRWDAAGNPLELGHLGTDGSGSTYAYAFVINASGQTAGQAFKYTGSKYDGDRAVLWNATTGAALELGNLGTNNQGYTSAAAWGINSFGQTVGYAERFSGNQSLGQRAVRWSNSGAIEELANLGPGPGGHTSSSAYAINDANQAVGHATKYVAGVFQGERAVRWDAAGNLLELGHLGLDAASTTYAYAFAINASGQTAGQSYKHEAGVFKGERAVRWDAAGNALELANLGTDPAGFTNSYAYSINTAGETAGRAVKYESGVAQGDRAVYWKVDGSAVDLNTLISSSGNWLLTRARAISDDGWITGYGTYDPDGPVGPVASYQRHFLLKPAAENNWLNPAGGDWGAGSNWSTNFAPGVAIDAVFNLSSVGGYTVNLSAAGEANALAVRTDRVTLNLNGQALNLNTLIVGRDSGDVAHLTLTGGTLNAPSIVVNDNSVLHFNGGTIAASSLQLAGSAVMKLAAGADQTLKVTALAVGGTSKLDLGDNRLVIAGGNIGSFDGSAYTGVTGLIDSGRGSASNTQWDGSGIVTSDTRAIASNDLCSIGVATAGQLGRTSFGGVSVDPADVLVMFTWGGDANLDGKINIDDYGRIDGNVGQSGSVFGWFNGDFNYDGKINIDDYGIIDGNINRQGTPFSTAGGVEGVAAVPEPISAVLCAAGLLLLRRRRRASTCGAGPATTGSGQSPSPRPAARRCV